MAEHKMPVKFEVVPESLESPFRDDFPSYEDGLVEGEPGGFVFSASYAKEAETILNFPPRPNDVWIVTFPKAGTTWTQELAWLVLNDCNFEGAKESSDKRVTFLEGECLYPSAKFHPAELHRTLDTLSQTKYAQVIKSHLPLSLLHPKLLETSKVIYVARNPKDVLVSYFHHHRNMTFQKFVNNIECFADYFMDGKVYWGPYFSHVLDAWNRRNHPNLLFLFFEDLKRDLRGQILKVAAFLNKELTDAQLDRLCEHLRFDNLSKNESVNKEVLKELGFMDPKGHFMRKGQVGDWKNHFSPELNQRFDQWIESNLAGTDLKFVTELDTN